MASEGCAPEAVLMKNFLLKLGVLAVLLVATGVASVKYFGRPSEASSFLPKPTIDEKITLSVLKSEALALLVTRRNTTQVVVEHRESDFLGRWNGVYWATVRWNWGVDLSALQEKDLRREGNILYCKLPEPKLLEFYTVPGTDGFYSKSTFVPKLREIFNSGQQKAQLEARLREKAMQFAAQQQLCPSRQEIADQLNRSAAPFKQALGAEIRFE
jgi:hypothetical protein